jgi:O-antigen ligase/tetratricopeptide (TPR) repeat protein
MARRKTSKAGIREVLADKPGRIPGSTCRNAAGLVGLAALLVAAPLVPGESTAELGVGANWIMLLLVLCAGSLASVFADRNATISLGVIDVLAGLLLLLVLMSSLVTAGQGNARATINSAWQWAGFVLLFLFSRQLLRRPEAMRAATAVMLALAVCLTGVAYYQYFYGLPQTRAEFAWDPEAMLRAAGLDPAADSPERKLFEDRLHSTEPLATFALANSLAGFLAPWLVVAAGIAIGARAGHGGSGMANAVPAPRPRAEGRGPLPQPQERMHLSWREACVAGLAVALIGFALLLTKSRTALLAVGLGIVLLALSRWPLARLRSKRWQVLGSVVLAVALLAVVVAAGVWDRQVVTETPKSLLYRFQYWQSTAAMIADHPWFGCGAGNFQQAYAAYKLPEASESIADPHNLFFEVAATLGLPALLAFSALLALVTWRWLRCGGLLGGPAATGAPANGPAVAMVPEAVPPLQTSPFWAAWRMYLGGLAGVALGWWTGFVVGLAPDGVLFWLGVPLAAAFLAGLHPWVAHGQLPRAVPAIALLVLTINLLAAGGISFAGIAPSWWLLLAMVSQSARWSAWERDLPRSAVGMLAAVALLLVIGCFATLYSPVLRCRAKLDQGLALLGEQRLAEAEAAFAAAAEIDPVAVEPWNNLAALYHHEALYTGSAHALGRFEAAVQQALRRNPRAPTLRKQIGDWRLALFARNGDRRQLRDALGAYAEWVQLYPNHAFGHAQLAWAYQLAGNGQAAKAAAVEALRLDALNPHGEKKLSQQTLAGPVADSAGPRENAEQTMRRLRK